jgi:hypothetical protein
MLDPGLHSTVVKIFVSEHSRVQLSCSRIAYLARIVAFFKNRILYIQQHTKSILRKINQYVPVFPGIRCIPMHTLTTKKERKKSRFSAPFLVVLSAPETSFQPQADSRVGEIPRPEFNL